MNEDTFAELQDSIEAKFEGLKLFTLNTLASERKKTTDLDERLSVVEQKLLSISISDVAGLNENMEAMREDVDDMKRKRTSHSPDHDRLTSPEPVKQKRTGLSAILVEDGPSIPTTLNHITNPDLRTHLEKYYIEKLPSPEKLTPAQLAFVHYYIFEKNSGKGSTHDQLINELYVEGVKLGIWTDSWTPSGIKGNFKNYLKEKVKNL
ncbi:hypothetical protein ACF0H5_003883 [Mactra antiquata]